MQQHCYLLIYIQLRTLSRMLGKTSEILLLSTLQRTTPHCNSTAILLRTLSITLKGLRKSCYCSNLQQHYNTLQHTATALQQHWNSTAVQLRTLSITLEGLRKTRCGQTIYMISSIPHTATHCNSTATHCNTLPHTATHCNSLPHTATHCHTLPNTATHCNALQRTATHCNALQRTATHSNKLL